MEDGRWKMDDGRCSIISITAAVYIGNTLNLDMIEAISDSTKFHRMPIRILLVKHLIPYSASSFVGVGP